MILEFIKHDFETLYLKLILISLIWFCILIAMAIDLGKNERDKTLTQTMRN